MLNPTKHVFDEPVVRVKTDSVRFPNVCPVCGVRATKISRIVFTHRKEWLLRSWDPLYSRRGLRLRGLANPEMTSFRVPVCEDHYLTDESECRYRLLCTICDGLLIAVILFAAMSFFNALWAGHSPSVWVGVAIILSTVALIASYIAFSPRPFEDAVRIIGFDHGTAYVWFEFKNPEYRDLFYKENEMNAELVKWVIRT